MMKQEEKGTNQFCLRKILFFFLVLSLMKYLALNNTSKKKGYLPSIPPRGPRDYYLHAAGVRSLAVKGPTLESKPARS